MNIQDIYNFIRVDENGCWIWQRAISRSGYGVCYLHGRQVPAHRASFEYSKGPISPGLFICHSCDVRSCINPAHLWAGSHQDNMNDMNSKHRGSRPPTRFGQDHWRNTRPELVRRGTDVPTSILTDDQVIGIRRDYVSDMPLNEIVKKYGVSRLSIPDYTSGKTWKHLLGSPGSPTMEELALASKKRRKSSAKITREIAEEIRKRIQAGELGKDLAAEYGVHKATISDIKLRKIWAD